MSFPFQIAAYEFGLLLVVLGNYDVCAHASDRRARLRRETGAGSGTRKPGSEPACPPRWGGAPAEGDGSNGLGPDGGGSTHTTASGAAVIVGPLLMAQHTEGIRLPPPLNRKQPFRGRKSPFPKRSRRLRCRSCDQSCADVVRK
ncbi:hypothetical protein DKT74_36820 [Streptomyces sp. ZEA17I]|nr:hypothetical protein DKT74_36820 [Streptomyces sp. ZEA17I]